MVKAVDFWNVVCEKLDYRFFVGVACKGFNPLYKKMKSDIMHYIPAVNGNTAIGLVTGASVTDFKSAVLIDEVEISDFIKLHELFISKIDTSFIIFMYNESKFYKKVLNAHKIPFIILGDNFESQLSNFDKKVVNNSQPGVVIIGKGVIQ